jgi:putative membrane protein
MLVAMLEAAAGAQSGAALGEKLARTWDVPPWATLFLLLAAWVYLRGFRAARRTRRRELPDWRAACFLGGLTWIWLALASPIDAFDDVLLTGHMVQHFILMSVGPPLIVLGAPTVPMLRGLPRWMIRRVLGRLFRWRPLHAFGRFLLHPVTAWLTMNIAYLAWHLPPAYELALRSENWHDVEHGCFFFTSVLFWWNVLQPWPSRAVWNRWLMVPYLVSADIVNTALAGSMAFSGHIWYPSYGTAPRVFGISALSDQIAAGAFMWVFGSLVFWVPTVVITMQMLTPPSRGRVRAGVRPGAGMTSRTATR